MNVRFIMKILTLITSIALAWAVLEFGVNLIIMLLCGNNVEACPGYAMAGGILTVTFAVFAGVMSFIGVTDTCDF